MQRAMPRRLLSRKPAALSRGLLCSALALSALSACLAPQRAVSPVSSPLLNRQSTGQATPLRSAFVGNAALPPALLAQHLKGAQAYSDQISQRRELDFFQLHSEVVGLKLNDTSYILSLLGTAKTRNDLNVEMRVLTGANTGMNLNYSGPVTRGLETGQPVLTQSSESAVPKGAGIHFELITGLPPEHITRTYGDHLEQWAQYLKYRFQSQPLQFDDGPLIYAMTQQEQLLGFAFFNQRNLLTLGERKYADVQSVAVVDTEGRLQGSYAVVAFNPKTASPQSRLNYQLEQPDDLGTLVLLGEF